MVTRDDSAPMTRGTRIVLQLKEDMQEVSSISQEERMIKIFDISGLRINLAMDKSVLSIITLLDCIWLLCQKDVRGSYLKRRACYSN